MDESKGWATWFEIGDSADRMLALYRQYIYNALWICPVIVAVGIVPSVNSSGLMLRLALIVPVSILALFIQVPMGLICVGITYLVNSTLRYPFSPRTFNTILYAVAYGWLAYVASQLAVFEHFYGLRNAHLAAAGVLFGLSFFVAWAGQWKASFFHVPGEKTKLTFDLKQIMILTTWISLVFALCLADRLLAVNVGAVGIATCIVLLAGRLLNR